MDGKAEGRWLCTSPCEREITIALIDKRTPNANNYCIEDKRTPSRRGEVLGADTAGPAVASRYIP